MPQRIERSSFAPLKKWVQDNRITFINAATSIVLIVVIIVVLLVRASILQRNTVEESLVNLAGMIAIDAQSRILTKLDIARSIAQPIVGFQGIDPENRRSFIKDTMQIGIASNNSLLNVFALWKPDEMDGMDAAFANTEGHNERGQFVAGFTRTRGWVESRTFGDYIHLLNEQFINHFGFGIENVSQPRYLEAEDMVFGVSDADILRQTWVIDTQIPVMSERSLHGIADIVGVVGATIDLGHLQFLSETTRPAETGQIFIVSNDGTIVAHQDPAMRGVMTLIAGVSGGLPFTYDVLAQFQEAVRSSFVDMEPVVLRTRSDLIVIHPFNVTSTITTTMTHGFAANPPWVVVSIVPMSTVMAPIHELVGFSVVFILGAAFLTILVLWTTSSSLTQQAAKLQQNLESATAMQDNLKFGLFLMDKSYKIQGAYSKALEKIMSVSNLNGKNFIELLSDSTKEHERKSIADYFEMILKQSFDSEMLERINPIFELDYVSVETGETKSLKTSFTIAEQGKTPYILGTVEDATAEKALTKQLREAESLRENEMRSLFQVIQLNPRVLKDFVADVEDEFERINDALKDKKVLEVEILTSLFQSVHAIKSNALVLNLDGFAHRLHALEGTIKKLREKYSDVVPLDDILTVVFEINDAMREVDRLKDTVVKIEDFRTMSGEIGNQEQYVLIETLNRVCEKTQIAVNKKVSFVVDVLDEIALDYGPRRAIKEILTQLVRNAVYHGIETPEERESAGKNPEGKIRLSIKYLDNHIRIILVDDGSGLDFERIKERAGRFTRAAAGNKNHLLKSIFLPGFTTSDAVDFHAGRGIGLSLVRDRVRSLDGSIKVATTKGTGTTFTIVIPVETSELDVEKVS